MTFLSGLTNRFTSSAVAAAAAAPPTAAQFEGWSAGAQAAYLSANSADDPPFLVIGDPGGAQILATLGFDGQTVTTAPVPQSYADAASSGNPPSSDDFARWDPELQLAFVRASGVTPPTALVLGDAAGPQTLAALNWNQTAVTQTPVPPSYNAALAAGTAPTADDFEGWPQQLQLAYAQAEIGSAPFLLVGAAAGPQLMITLAQNNTAVVTAPVPASYTAAAAGAAPKAGDVQGWPQQLQLAYLNAHGAGSPKFLIVGDPKDAQALLKPSSDGKGVVTSAVPQSYSSAVLTGKAPTATAAAGWDPALRLAFLTTGSTDDPPFLVTADANGRYDLLTLDRGGKVAPSPAPPSYATAMSTGAPPSTRDARDWPAALQLSFLRSGSSDVPPFMVGPGSAGNPSLLTLDPSGRSIDSSPLPPDYLAAISKAASPPAKDFGAGPGIAPGAWPAALQLTYLRTMGVGTPPAAVVGATSPNGFVLTLSADGRGAVPTAFPQSYIAAAAAYAAPPSTMTTSAFQALTQAQQLAYLQSNGTGTPPALVLDAGSPDAVLVTPSAADPTAVAVTPMANVLQSWAPPLQLGFVQVHGTSATLGDGTPATIMVLGTGQNVYTAALGAGGTAVSVLKGDVGSPGYWGTTTANATAADATALLTPPSVATFQSWTASQQAAYVAAQGTAVGASMLIGGVDAAKDGTQIVATLLPGGGIFTAPVPQSYVQAWNGKPTLSVFQTWPEVVQAAYVAGIGTGPNPSFQLDGPPLVTVALGSGGVTITSTLPSDPSLSYSTLEEEFTFDSNGRSKLGDISFYDDFMGTPDDVRQMFVTALQADADSNTPKITSGVSAAQLADLKSGIIDLVTPAQMADSTVVTLATSTGSIKVKVPSSAFPPLSADGTSPATDFSTWPPQLQTAYVAQMGQTIDPSSPAGLYPRSVVISGEGGADGETATLLAPGDQVQITPNPAGFLSAFGSLKSAIASALPGAAITTAVTAQDFVSWPSACQQAFAARAFGTDAGGSSASPNGPVAAVSLAGPPDGLSLQSTTAGGASPVGWTLVVGTAFLSQPPATVSQAMLSALPQASALAYLQVYGTGVPPFIKFGSGAGATIMASVATAAGSFIGITPLPLPTATLPGGYDTPPASLDPATFLSWPAAVRQSYVTDFGTGTPRTVQFGPASAPQVTASLSASGQLSVVTTPNALSTSGMADNTIPYFFLPGALGGVASTIDQTVANTLFPVLNGDPSVAGSALLTVDATGKAVAQTPDQQTLVDQYNTAPADLDPAVFGGWNSAVQLQYMRAHAADFADGCLAIGNAGDASGVVHAFMSAPTVPQLVPQKVYVVENLQKIDIAKMPLVDQQALAGMPAFQPIAQSLNLIPDGVRTIAPGHTSGVDASGKPLPAAQALVSAIFTTAAGQISDPTTLTPTQPDGDMPAADKKVFSDELALLQQQLSTSAIYSPTDIQTQVDTIMTRFARANAFSCCVNKPGSRAPDVNLQLTSFNLNINTNLRDGNTSIPVPSTMSSVDPGQYSITVNGKAYDTINSYILQNYTQPLPAGGSKGSFVLPSGSIIASKYPQSGNTYSIINITLNGDQTISGSFTQTPGEPASLDNNATINAGYNVFITQEQQILSLAQRAQSVATTGKLTDQALDGPDLVYMFQLFANLTGEAVVRVDTEEVNQTNSLLQMYSAMQQAVQTAVQACGTDTSGDHTMPTTSQTTQLQALFSLNGGNVLSPIEILKGVQRPVNSNASSSDTSGSSWSLPVNLWNSYNQQLSTAVSSINQDSQIKMNDINDETKEKDRNFDLANSALQKAQDVLSQINSVGAG